MWGAHEKWNLNSKKNYFNNTIRGIPIVLELFEKYNIHATWATVGFLFAKNKTQMLNYCPDLIPTYDNIKMSYYHFIKSELVGENEVEDPYHYASSLIDLILKTPNQELATHTFSHYYCNEKGQTCEQFEADLEAAQAISKENFNIELRSLVFPRNQFNSAYIKIAKKNGIKVIRSNPDVWFWKKSSKWMALARALDSLIPISKTLTYNKARGVEENAIMFLPASRFFRPYSKSESFLQKLKYLRIKKEMTYAAKNNKIYHLWWHPHNFGNNLEENVAYLEKILNHFIMLNVEYNFCSKTMIEEY